MTKCNVYDIGDKARVFANFTAPGTDLAVDPGAVYLDFADPDGNQTTWLYGTDPDIVKLGTGSYEAYIPLDKAGYWWYSWRGTGVSSTSVEQERFFVRDTAITSPVSGYSSREDLYNTYGRHNVDKWADMNNDGTEPDIINRINWAIGLADSEINSRLHNSPWVVPFTAPFDPIIVDLSARLAGVLLYEARGVTDANLNNHELLIHRNHFEKVIRQLLGGQRALTGAARSYSYWPQNILADD